MRIAVWHNLPSGGGKRALYDHIKGLLARGHEITVWCPPTADQSFLPLSELVEERVVPLREAERPPLPYRVIGPVAYMRSRLQAMDEHCRLVAREMSAGDFDIVFGNSCTDFRVTPLARHLPQVPTVLYLQEPYRWLYEAMPELPWLAPAAGDRAHSLGQLGDRLRSALHRRALGEQARFERDNAAAYDRILVNSLFSRESVLRAYNLDSRVCYLGVDPDRFCGVTPLIEEGPYVLGVGAIVPEKNIELAVRAVASSGNRPVLRWAGNVAAPSEQDRLERLAAASGVDLRIEVMASHQRVSALLAGASMLIYTPRLEPFGFVPLEGALLGVPTVGVAEGGLRETVVDKVTGLLAGPDAGSLGDAIDLLLDDAILRKRMGQAAAARAREVFSVEAATTRLENELHGAAKRREPLSTHPDLEDVSVSSER